MCGPLLLSFCHNRTYNTLCIASLPVTGCMQKYIGPAAFGCATVHSLLYVIKRKCDW